MARNIEIKASVPDLARVRSRVSAVATSPVEFIEQTDTFFVPGGDRGRLKVREFADGSGELIAYSRPDQTGPKTSTYLRSPCQDASLLVAALAAALPIRAVVRKRRELWLVGRTRVHLDEVERLGTFVELEVVLADDESTEVGDREAHALLALLDISPSALIAVAYVDLLEGRALPVWS